MSRREAGFANRKSIVVLSAVLLIQAAGAYAISKREATVTHTPLQSVPSAFPGWTQTEEGTVEEEVRQVLKADDVLSRTYADTNTGASAHMFVAYFRSQRAGQAPHSPKNCLPGSGWVPSESNIVPVEIPGRGPIEVNRYIVEKAGASSLVMYWYQSRDRVVADEYRAKFYVVADAIRYNRTDTALVRVVVPIRNRDKAEAERAAVSFIQSFFSPLRRHFPA